VNHVLVNDDDGSSFDDDLVLEKARGDFRQDLSSATESTPVATVFCSSRSVVHDAIAQP
jgi:hypothetical protein